ncbi:MAG: hypothetical protein KGZ72_10700 [Roseovarius sp.]|jgi:hypothetical protein|nr:hypothetical protein [Roseovarius sp.]
MLKDKQLALKPFDFVLSVKIAVNRGEDFLLAQLANEFEVSISTIHAALGRAEMARLLSRSAGSLRALRPALQEFAIHGLKYAFPAVVGRAGRGLPTAVGAPVLARQFDAGDGPVPVWPHAEGTTYGFEVIPLHPSVPKVASRDQGFYEVLALVDALRVGAAREREIALHELKARL